MRRVDELAVVELYAMVRLVDKVVPVVCPFCKLVVLHVVVEVVVIEVLPDFSRVMN